MRATLSSHGAAPISLGGQPSADLGCGKQTSTPVLGSLKCWAGPTTSPSSAEGKNLSFHRTRSVRLFPRIPCSRLGVVDQSPCSKVVIWDDAKQKVVITLEFRTQVHRVRLCRSRIIIVLQNSVHMYAFSSPPEKLSVFETADNPLGLCCLGDRVLAFPGRTPGQLQIVEMKSGNVSFVLAHGSPLRAMDLSPDGEVLATASETVCLAILTSQNSQAEIIYYLGNTHPRLFYK